VALLAGMSRFIIADLTKPKSTPLEAMLIVPQIMVPFAPVIRKGEKAFAMFDTLRAKYDWILETFEYRDSSHLLTHWKKRIIDPCEKMNDELVRRRRAAEARAGAKTGKRSPSTRHRGGSA